MRFQMLSLLLLCIATLTGFSRADTIFVAQDGSGDFFAIKDAIDAASGGDEIIISPEVYYEHVEVPASLVGGLTFTGTTNSNGTVTTLRTFNSNPLVRSATDTSFSNILFDGRFYGDIQGDGAAFSDETSGANGNSTSVVFLNCQFLQNEANGNGGAINKRGGTLVVEGSIFEGNHANQWPARGGAICFDSNYNATSAGQLLIDSCLFRGNIAGEEYGPGQWLYGAGGAVHVDELADVVIANSSFQCNRPDDIGGGNAWSGSNNDFQTCELYVSQDGSGDYFYIQDAINNSVGGEQIIISSEIYDESLFIPDDLSDMAFIGTTNVNGTRTQLQNNATHVVYCEGDASFASIRFGPSFGGGIQGGSGQETTLAFQDCVFEDLTTGGNGGAINKLGGTLIVEACEFKNNWANTWPVRGGAICFDSNANATSPGELFVDGCVFEGNIAGDGQFYGEGGAIHVDAYAQATISNSFFECNRPDDIGGGNAWSGSGNTFKTCVLTVAQDGTGDYSNIQDAINDAADGYIIEVSAETYYESIVILDREVTIEGTIPVNGNATDRTTINSMGWGSVVESWNSVTLRDLRLENGSFDVGGGFAEYFFSDTDVVMENVWIENCTAEFEGGGIRKLGGSLTLTDCRLFNNNATYGAGGGLFNVNATVIIESTEIKSNGNGGWYNGPNSVSTLANSTITCNRPYQIQNEGELTDLGGNDIGGCVYTVCADGGCDFTTIQEAVDYAQGGEIIEVWPGTYRADPWDGWDEPVVDMTGKAITLRSRDGADVTIIHGDDERRGILCSNSNASLSTVIQGFTIRDCRTNFSGAPYEMRTGGAGLRCESSSPTILDCVFVENVNEGYGSYQNWQVDNSGGAILLENSNASVLNCTFMANVSQYYGGAVANSNSTATYSDCMFEGNAVGQYESGGGAVYCYESMDRFENCIFKHNSGPQYTGDGPGGGYQPGGAVTADYSDPYFVDCTFTFNECSAYSGVYYSFADFVNCEFSGNEGCGIINNVSSSYVQDSTFCENEDDICGAWVDLGDNEFLESCLPPFTCQGDTNLDYDVDVLDILYILATWGTSNPAGDIDGNGIVDVNDILIVIAGWGPCPN
ncbi:MAG: hypothetical protein MK089_09260 [Phycisphaerales bacterium]|nr:hypothetical protein [Phycisphaerales bacterium]